MKNDQKMYAILGIERAEPTTCLCETCLKDDEARVKAFNNASKNADVKSGFEDCSENVTLVCSECGYKPAHYSDLTISSLLNSLLDGQPYTLTKIDLTNPNSIGEEVVDLTSPKDKIVDEL